MRCSSSTVTKERTRTRIASNFMSLILKSDSAAFEKFIRAHHEVKGGRKKSYTP